MIRHHSSLKKIFVWVSAVEIFWKVEIEMHQYISAGLQDRFLCLFLIVTLE